MHVFCRYCKELHINLPKQQLNRQKKSAVVSFYFERLLRTYEVLGSLLPCRFLKELGKIVGWQERGLRFSFSQFLNRDGAFLCSVE